MGADREDIVHGGRTPSLLKLVMFAATLLASFQLTMVFLAPAAPAQKTPRKLAGNNAGLPATCNVMPKTELGGFVVKWGATNLVDAARDCCDMCRETAHCNIWVWCGDPVLCPASMYRSCWLKNQTIVKGQSLEMFQHGGKCPWTSGWLAVFSEPKSDTVAKSESVSKSDHAVEAAADGAGDTCNVLPNSDMAGHVVKWGTTNLLDSAEHCCDACKSNPDCNIWVFCGDPIKCPAAMHRSCWLKNQTIYKDLAPGVMASGKAVPWTGGWLPRYSKQPNVGALGFEMKAVDLAVRVGEHPVRERECGQPAIDGYSHVVPECLVKSKTAKEFDVSEEARLKLVVWVEEHASYDGLAVGWGIGNKKPTAEACADACRRHIPDTPGNTLHGGLFGSLPCNAWVWCPMGVKRCFEPDAHTHTGGDCWLKFTEVPEAVEVNARGTMDDPGTVRNGVTFKARHKDAHDIVPWVSGVLLPEGMVPTNGTWGPRAQW